MLMIWSLKEIVGWISCSDGLLKMLSLYRLQQEYSHIFLELNMKIIPSAFI